LRVKGASKNVLFRHADDALAEPWPQIGHEGRGEALHLFDCAEIRR
jgi:hypothetical protein